MVNQLKNRVFPILNHRYPGIQCLFVFDNSTCHSAYAEDALRAQNMTVSDDSKSQPKMRDGWYWKTVELDGVKIKQRVSQSFQTRMEKQGG